MIPITETEIDVLLARWIHFETIRFSEATSSGGTGRQAGTNIEWCIPGLNRAGVFIRFLKKKSCQEGGGERKASFSLSPLPSALRQPHFFLPRNSGEGKRTLNMARGNIANRRLGGLR